MAKKIRMRRRDLPSEPAPAPAVADDIVRLERLLAEMPSPDLTPLEAQLRTMRAEMDDLKALLGKMPAGVPNKAANYRFVVHRRDDQLIDYVDGIVLPDNPNLLQRTAAKLH